MEELVDSEERRVQPHPDLHQKEGQKLAQPEYGSELGPLVEEFHRRYPGPQAAKQFVFIGDDGVTPTDDRDVLRYEFRPVLKRLGLYYPGFGLHAFRRQNVTWRQQVGGATPLEAQKAAGHGSLNMGTCIPPPILSGSGHRFRRCSTS